MPRNACLAHNEYDINETTPTVAVTEAVARAADVDPLDVDLALEDYINSSALDALLGDSQTDITLEFETDSYTVRLCKRAVHVYHNSEYDVEQLQVAPA